MSPTVQRNLPPMEVTTLESRPSTALNSIEGWRALVGRALGRAGLSQKHAAADIGLNEAQFSRQLAGIENLSFWKMHALPPEFWQELVLLIVDFHGLALGGTEQDRRDVELGRTIRDAITRSLSR